MLARLLTSVSCLLPLGEEGSGLGSVGPEILTLRWLPMELRLDLGSKEGRELETFRENHFEGFEKREESPDGDTERVIDGNEGEALFSRLGCVDG